MELLFTLITVQTLLGALDNLWHHEITERLPSKRSASDELTLHATREALYGFVFIALAWFAWHGWWAVLLAGVFAIEIVITIADFLVEDRTRRLPRFERVLHTVLAVNYGVVLAVLAPILFAWWSAPTAIVPVHHGAMSWVFTMFAIGVVAWSVRNAVAVLRHRRPAEWVRNPIVAGTREERRVVLVTGATGFIGGHLVRRLVTRGDSVIVLTRDPDRALERFGPHVRIVTSLDTIAEDTRIHAIVNLAGEPILGWPWTRARRRKLIESRLETTRKVVALAARLTRAPRVLVSASAIGYYGVHDDEPIDEGGAPQPIFQSRLCQQWEQAAAAAEGLGVRTVRLRIGLVLGRDGGALPRLAMPVRLGVGAVLGSGRQWVSWIHIRDLVRLIEFVLDLPTLRGPINAVAPQPAMHLDLQRALARTLRRPLWFRVPGALPRAALGEMAQLLLDGQRVVPARPLAAGFTFRYERIESALADLVGKASPCDAAESTRIYYNGDCPVCLAEMTHYEKVCNRASVPVTFVDATKAPNELAACGLRSEHLDRRVYLRGSGGRMVSGLAALIELWRRMPRYRWLARVVSTPGVRQASTAFYDLALAPALDHWARARRHGVRTRVSTR
jgi:uncharacterized protein (TIGR01777 family)